MIIAYIKVGVSLHQSVKEAKAMRGDTNRWELIVFHKQVRTTSDSLWGETQGG